MFNGVENIFSYCYISLKLYRVQLRFTSKITLIKLIQFSETKPSGDLSPLKDVFSNSA